MIVYNLAAKIRINLGVEGSENEVFFIFDKNWCFFLIFC